MATIVADIDNARHLGVAEAKARLSNLVADVQGQGSSYVIERYGKPAALVCPMPRRNDGPKRARGLLSAYADPDKRPQEEGAFARAMEAKHGRPA